MSHRVLRAGVAAALVLLLPSCYGVRLEARTAGPAALAVNFYTSVPELPVPQVLDTSLAQRVVDRGSVQVRGFHEPGDWGHRNYCGAGATQVLLSIWLQKVPDIETIARRARLNPAIRLWGTRGIAASR